MGESVLNTELKTKNIILMLLFVFSKCAKTEWRAVDQESFVDLLVVVRALG